MLKQLLIYMLIFSLVFPPGSLDSAWAQNSAETENRFKKERDADDKKHDEFTTKIQKTYMALNDMLMVQRFPDAPRLSFQKAPTEASLQEARVTLDVWQGYLKQDWQELLSKSLPQADETTLVTQSQNLALEAFMYFQSHYLYLANLAFLRKVEPSEITKLVKQMELRIPVESIGNYQFYFSAIVKFFSVFNDLSHGANSKTEVRLDRCSEGVACLIFSMNETRAYRALETPLKYSDDNEGFHHFSRLLILENYIASFAKLEHYLNLPAHTLKLPEKLVEKHPSLPYLYQEQKDFIRFTFKRQFHTWLEEGGNELLTEAFDILEKDPQANLLNEEFLKKFTKILGTKGKNAWVLQDNFLTELKEKTKGRLISDFMILFKLWPVFDDNGNFITSSLLDTLLLTKNLRIKSELLSVPDLDKNQISEINSLIKNELNLIKTKLNNTAFYAKVNSIYPEFKKSQSYPSNEVILHEMHNTIEQLSSFRGVDYQSLLAGIAASNEFQKLNISDSLEEIYNRNLIKEFENDAITENPNVLANLQTKLGEKYYEVLLALYRRWQQVRRLNKEAIVNEEFVSSLNQLAANLDPKKDDFKYDKVLKKNDYALTRKNLYDWIQIGQLLKIHDGNGFISELLTDALKTEDDKQNQTKAEAISLNDFGFNEKGNEKALKVYKNSLELKLSSRFPMLSAKGSRVERIEKRMEYDRKLYDVPIHIEQALWKHLSGKDYAQTRIELLEQMKKTKDFLQEQINRLAADTNTEGFFAQIKSMAARLKLTQMDESNINLPEVLSLHLSYSTILAAELTDYSKREKLTQFRNQYLGKSDFHKAIEEYVNYSGAIFLGMIAFRLLSWATFFRHKAVLKFFPSFQKTSSAITRDGMTSVFGTAAKFRGQPIMLFGAQQSWFDLSFWGGMLANGSLSLYQGIDSFINDIPKLTESFDNQVACNSGSEELDENCQLNQQSIAERKDSATEAVRSAAASTAVIGGLLYVLPKALAWFQKMQSRMTSNSTKRSNQYLEALVRDNGQLPGKSISFSAHDIRSLTLSILKEFRQAAPTNLARQEMAERIFVLKRYLELRKRIQLENIYWNSIDDALAVHWKRLGITPGTNTWNKRYNSEFINAKYAALQIEFNAGRLKSSDYEKLTQDFQIIASTLQPAWKLLTELGSSQNGMYARLVQQTLRKRTGEVDGFKLYEGAHTLTQRVKDTHSAVYFRAEQNSKGEIALIRFAPYELRPEAIKLLEKIKNRQLVRIKRDKQ